MLYTILKIIIKVALKVFFRQVKVNHKQLIPHKGPMIVVANHPNTFMDPLVVAAHLKPQVYFIANSSIFATPFTRWLFRQLHMIPIHRKIDTAKTKINNTEIFQKCYDFLGSKGTLLIFPEGISVRERRLRKLKTGTARIALGAEAQQDFHLDLKILTIGLNYSNPESFRSDVFLNIDEPIKVADYRELYLQDSFKAAHVLTEDIRQRLEKHIIVTKNEAEDQLAKQIETIYKRKLSDDIQLSTQKKEQEYLITKGIIEALQHFETQDPDRVASFQSKIQNYLTNLDRLDLSDEVFAKKTNHKGIFWASLQTAVYFIVGFPLFLYGLINNYIPYIIPSKVAIKLVNMTKVEEYMAAVMMVTGIFTFTFFYILQVFLFQLFIKEIGLTLLYLISLPVSGFFALFYANYLYTTKDKWRLFTLFYKRASLVSTLIQQRKEIIQILEKAKKDYLSYYQEKN